MKKSWIVKILALCLLVCMPANAFAFEWLFGKESNAVDESRIAESSIEDDGVLRVYLKSLGSTKQLTLTLDGNYTVENDAGFRFARDAQVLLDAVGNDIYLTSGGLTIAMGSAMTFTRQASDTEMDGIYIAESEKQAKYTGDLNVSIDDNGALRCILHINMEDYLKGVIAYEMNDSWPLETLKAQAVAARTYAMQRKWNAGSRDYDLVDTTADQVYKGYNEVYTNVSEAVEATNGVVGMYKGGFATCYYTASNGGQTALPQDVWSGGGDYGYLERTDDPYDLENPYSIVQSMRFTPALEGSEKLKDMISAQLIVAAADKNISLDGLQFERVISVEPVNPVAEGSKMYQTLRFGVKASLPVVKYLPTDEDIGHLRGGSGNRAADMALYGVDYLRRLIAGSAYIEMPTRNMIEEPFYIDIDVFTQVKDELGLSINSGDYEMVSVVEDTEGYTIEMRRFGHGVGMSQRGAQMMGGQHGMNYLEILEFYYPGMDIERIEWNTPALEAIDDLPEGIGFARAEPTPKPTPAPLPPLEKGEYYAVVTLSDASSTLNMRAEPGTHSQVVELLNNGRRVIVSGEADEDGWVSVHTAEVEGYVKLEYLKAE